jgi:hypothetical protein
MNTDWDPRVYKRNIGRHPFYKESNGNFKQNDNEYGPNSKNQNKALNKEDNTNDDIKARIADRMNTLQRFNKDTGKAGSNILSFSNHRDVENDSLGLEIVGPCPSIKLYSDNVSNTNNNISSDDHKVVEMLSKRSNKIENASSDVSTYRQCNISQIKEIINKRPNSCGDLNKASKNPNYEYQYANELKNRNNKK